MIKGNNEEINGGMADIKDVFSKITSVIESISGISSRMVKINKHVDNQIKVNSGVNEFVQQVKERSDEIKSGICEQKNGFSEIIKAIAEEESQSPNGLRMVLVQAGVYVKKDATKAADKKENINSDRAAETGKRCGEVNKNYKQGSNAPEVLDGFEAVFHQLIFIYCNYRSPLSIGHQ